MPFFGKDKKMLIFFEFFLFFFKKAIDIMVHMYYNIHISGAKWSKVFYFPHFDAKKWSIGTKSV